MFDIGLQEIFALAFFIAFSITGYNIAQKKQRNAWLWAIAIFVLPLFIIILLCLGDNHKTKYFTYCYEDIREEDKVCKHADVR